MQHKKKDEPADQLHFIKLGKLGERLPQRPVGLQQMHSYRCYIQTMESQQVIRFA